MVKTNKIFPHIYEYHCISKRDINILFTLSVLSLEYLNSMWGQIFIPTLYFRCQKVLTKRQFYFHSEEFTDVIL